jgi:ATP-binding cassette subfamily B (MDR/TAP) protein 1
MQECVEVLCCVSHSYFLYIYRDLTKLEDGIGDKVVQFIHFMGSFVGSLILALTKGWLLALVCLSALPVTLIAVGIVSVVQYPFH